MSECNHSWTVSAQSFTIICTKCEAEYIASQQIIPGDFGVGPNDKKAPEPPYDAYDRAMRGIK